MITKCIDAVMKVIEIICMILLALAVIFVTMQIVFRYFLSSPLGWTEQSSRFCFIWIVMMGIPIMFHRKCEISFDFLREKLTGRTHKILMLGFEILGIFFCAVYFLFSVSLCIRTGNRMTSGLAIPLNCLYVAQPVSAVLTALVLINRIVETVKEKGRYKIMLLVALAIFFVLLAFGAPVFLCMGCSSVVWILFSDGIPGLVIAQKMYTATDSFALMAIPFFMLAGQIMERTGITDSIVDFANSLVGHIRGGLALTCELAGILMGGISGSGNADCSALGSMLLPALEKSGYDEGFACSVVASAANLAPIIPSIIMILYCNAAGLNIGELFMAGFVPGLSCGILYMLVCHRYAKKHQIAITPFKGLSYVWQTFKKAIFALIMPMIIIGGILFGIFTATEAGVAACVYGIVYGFITKKLSFKDLKDSLRGAVISTASPVALIAISSMFSYVLSREGVTSLIAEFCVNTFHSQVEMFLFIVVVCVILGCFVDGTAIILLMTPILVPIVQQMGFNLLQFSIIFMMAIMCGGLTPPVGATIFVVSGVQGTPISKISKPILPFVGCVIVVTLLLCFSTSYATFLPKLMGY